jgi:hypothetical protein
MKVFYLFFGEISFCKKIYCASALWREKRIFITFGANAFTSKKFIFFLSHSHFQKEIFFTPAFFAAIALPGERQIVYFHKDFMALPPSPHPKQWNICFSGLLQSESFFLMKRAECLEVSACFFQGQIFGDKSTMLSLKLFLQVEQMKIWLPHYLIHLCYNRCCTCIERQCQGVI